MRTVEQSSRAGDDGHAPFGRHVRFPLTGRYNWRSRLKQGVLGGLSPPLLEPGRLTVPAFLKQHGYQTACVGKWHLGMTWPRKPGAEPFQDDIEKGVDGWRVDFSKPITRGPNSAGFDHFDLFATCAEILGANLPDTAAARR